MGKVREGRGRISEAGHGSLLKARLPIVTAKAALLDISILIRLLALSASGKSKLLFGGSSPSSGLLPAASAAGGFPPLDEAMQQQQAPSSGRLLTNVVSSLLPGASAPAAGPSGTSILRRDTISEVAAAAAPSVVHLEVVGAEQVAAPGARSIQTSAASSGDWKHSSFSCCGMITLERHTHTNPEWLPVALLVGYR